MSTTERPKRLAFLRPPSHAADADPPTQPGARAPKGDRSAPRRARGEGWRSVGLSVVVSAILAGLALYTDAPVERVEAVAMWIVLTAALGVAGKDIGRVADAVVEAARALRGPR